MRACVRACVRVCVRVCVCVCVCQCRGGGGGGEGGGGIMAVPLMKFPRGIIIISRNSLRGGTEVLVWLAFRNPLLNNTRKTMHTISSTQVREGVKVGE